MDIGTDTMSQENYVRNYLLRAGAILIYINYNY